MLQNLMMYLLKKLFWKIFDKYKNYYYKWTRMSSFMAFFTSTGLPTEHVSKRPYMSSYTLKMHFAWEVFYMNLMLYKHGMTLVDFWFNKKKYYFMFAVMVLNEYLYMLEMCLSHAAYWLNMASLSKYLVKVLYYYGVLLVEYCLFMAAMLPFALSSLGVHIWRKLMINSSLIFTFLFTKKFKKESKWYKF